VVAVFAKVASNPVKSAGNSYRVVLDVSREFNGEVYSSCRGKITAFIPAGIVEAHYPGKLYSAAGTDSDDATLPLVEMGMEGWFHGKYGKSDFFTVEKVESRGWKNALEQFRGFCRLQLKRLLHSWGDGGGLLLALLSGSREDIETGTGKAFKNAGLSHVLALSGMHVSLFSGMAAAMGKKIRKRNLVFLVSFAMVAIFVFFAGLSPSLLRAFLSTTLALVCSFFMIEASALSVLALSFLIHLVIAPADGLQVSFLLSYAAVAGILILPPRILPLLCPFVPKKICEPFVVSISAQVFTAPLTIYFFSCIMPIGIASSVIVSPLVSIFFIFGFFATIACLCCPILIFPAGEIINFLYFLIRITVEFFGKVPPITF
ncbi:MAG: ComEC/Rec2 family competence protein, partial [Spirochaetaceae bacterium]|nr:ComEC/Rec2 family competence protein [Spirochaetaceae bacterium]